MDAQVKETFKNAFSLAYKIALLYFAVLALWGLSIRYTESLHDGDIYFSMAYGRQYLRDHTLRIDENQFSWVKTFKKGSGIYPSWIPHFVFYEAYRLMGYKGLYLIRFFILAIIFLLFFLMARKLKLFDFSGLLMLLLFIYFSMAITGLMLKADMFSVFWLTIEAYLLYSYRINSDKKILLLFPILFVLWANSHVSVIAGLGIFGLWAVLNLIYNRFWAGKEETRNAVGLLASAIVSGFSIFITNKPFYLFNLARSKFISLLFFKVYANVDSGHLNALNYIEAFTPVKISINDILFLWMLAVSLIFISLSASYYYFSRNNEEKSRFFFLFDFVILSVLFILGLKIGRTSYMFAVFSSFSIIYITFKMKGLLSKNSYFRPIINVMALLMLFFFIKQNLFIDREHGNLGPGAWTPVLEVEYIKSHIPSGSNIFTTLSPGSYLMFEGYPYYKDYMDSRMGHVEDYVNLMNLKFSKMKKPLDENKFDVALVAYKELPFMYHYFVRRQDIWKPVFWAQAAVVFVKRKKFPELEFESPDPVKMGRYMQWPYFTSRIVEFLLMEGKYEDAITLLNVAKITMPSWYKFSEKPWQLVFHIFLSQDIIGEMYKNMHRISTMPVSIQDAFLYLSRLYEYKLFDEGRYEDALRVENFIFRLVARPGISLYNQGLITFKKGDLEQARRLLHGAVENIKGENDVEEDAKRFAERILTGEEVNVTSKDLL